MVLRRLPHCTGLRVFSVLYIGLGVHIHPSEIIWSKHRVGLLNWPSMLSYSHAMWCLCILVHFNTSTLCQCLVFSRYIVYTEKNYIPFSSERMWYPTSMRRWPTVGLLLAHRLRHWPNSKPTLGQRLVFAWYTLLYVGLYVCNLYCLLMGFMHIYIHTIAWTSVL